MELNEMYLKIQHNYKVSIHELASRTRKAEYIELRQFLCSYLRDYNNMSLKKIGKILNRDHATVINALNVYKDRMLLEPSYANRYWEFIYIMRQSIDIERRDKALSILELIENKKTIGCKIRVIEKLLIHGSKVV